MEEFKIFLLAFAGCLWALLIHDVVYFAIKFKTKPKQKEKQVIKRVVAQNYGKFADPIGESYAQFKDEKTNLYTSYVPKKNVRRENINE